MNIHMFDSTGEAYDACQCDEGIKKGDVLVIKKEHVVGIAGTWPIAVTAKHGELHTLNAGVIPEVTFNDEPSMLQGWHDAHLVAQELGYEVGKQ